MKEVKKFDSKITLSAKGKTMDAGKLMMIMGMGIKQGDVVTVSAEGEDEDTAIAAIEKFFKEIYKGSTGGVESYTGKSIFQKVAVGRIFYYEKNENLVKRNRIEETEGEIKRFEAAKLVALGQLDRIYQKALKEVGEDNEAVFEVHKMMMDDEYIESKSC